MMKELRLSADEPLIQLCENQAELEALCGCKGLHGFFDPERNLIVSTADSLAHEIGHYRDYRSGKMKRASDISDPLERAEIRLRNEIVAVLFAYSKAGEGGVAQAYEFEFIRWCESLIQNEPALKKFSKDLKKISFIEMQEIAEILANSSKNWFARLEFLFASYLQSEHFLLTYSKGKA